MEYEPLLSDEDSSRLRRIGLIAGIAFSFAALYSIWSHGLRSWEWVQDATFALFGFTYGPNAWQQELLQRGWRWRVSLLVFGTLYGAWIGHEIGWVLGGCIIALVALTASERKTGWWSSGIKKPLGLLQLAIVAVGGVWFIATTKGWVPFGCVMAILLLLGEKPGRRSMRENLLRVKSVGWVATLGLAFYWSWKEPSFASILALIAVPVLWFGSLLMHLSSGERPFALSHPQS
jgi:hypothetical protein